METTFFGLPVATENCNKGHGESLVTDDSLAVVHSTRLAKEFFRRRALEVAPDLLGCLLASGWPDDLVGGLISEVEAYEDNNDPASHAWGGPKQRNRVMYEAVGRAYVYFIYGNHFCFNVVCHQSDRAGAVLVRGLLPTVGKEKMQTRRGRPSLSDGPGKLCQALAIDSRHNRLDLTCPDCPILLSPARQRPCQVLVSPRIGIRKAQELPWRFVGRF